MLAQDIDYFVSSKIPCSSSGFYIYTIEDYYKYHDNVNYTVHISEKFVHKVIKP